MPADTWHSGRAAAPGLAAGPLFEMPEASAGRRMQGSAEQESEALRAALGRAIDDITILQQATSTDAAEILEFQVAMLSDDALAEPAMEQIAHGMAAEAAWREAMDAQIAGYASSSDEYFRARAGDLADMRDRVLDHLLGTADVVPPPGAIVLATDLAPSRFLAWDWSAGGGVALKGGSPTSHVAMLARARRVPMVVGLTLPARLPEKAGAATVLLDGAQGRVNLAPEAAEIAEFERRRAGELAAAAHWESFLHRPASTGSGERVLTQVNVADPAELDHLDPGICDGIGLVRTEFLFHDRAGLPDEDSQFAVYRRILDWAAGRPVTIRTLDAGGDKPIRGLTGESESNPFLGVRGIRLSLARTEVFRIQLRALARAAALGPLKVMLPMVTIPEEVSDTALLLRDEIAALGKAGIDCREPDLGIMVEVPAAALAVERFPAAFFSIGSNDLTQYVTAAARDITAVAALNDSANPAVLELIERVARFGRHTGREVSLCGDAGGDPAMIPLLLERGVRNLSMAPAMLARAKAVIAGWSGPLPS
ncbi:phosphoenolpyruvate--protein phosphotransferase [Dongia mobilis]|uniref:Phosphoenolpyruvate-protein phosphotransferase n=1 Tax=Dongia mobilis TaxID=578943 RepID=A0A4R6WHA2_9PROT|nr:phosphoenolpyruvate--protein phosphotransferase [Dongia mobilis]TDQ77655.1 phosphoenolpyruvate--protein phosphotransferase [Dongia mobilis]